MTIDEIYDKYKIPKILREHMYRVAATAQVVCDCLDKDIFIDKNTIIKTALLHDMGNLVKIYMVDTSFIQKQERESLEKGKDEFISKYGNEEYLVTNNILKEIGVSEEIIDLYNNIGSSKIPLTIESGNWNRKVCSYSDFRVAPNGVVSVTERFDEVIRRYNGKNHILADIEKTEQKKKNALILESQIQEKCNIDLLSIDNKSIEDKIIELKEYKII